MHFLSKLVLRTCTFTYIVYGCVKVGVFTSTFFGHAYADFVCLCKLRYSHDMLNLQLRRKSLHDFRFEHKVFAISSNGSKTAFNHGISR